MVAAMVVQTNDSREEIALGRGTRLALMGFGCLNVGLGVLGIALPVMPSTIFFIIALWAFSKSSRRLHDWLYSHPVFGRTLRDWDANRVIPVKAKCLAVGMMSASLLYVTFFVATGWLLPAGLAVVLGGVASYIVTRPSYAPELKTA